MLWVALGPGHNRRAADPVTTAAPANIPVRTTPSVPSFGPAPFGEAKGRFAVVVDRRLWLVDARSREVYGVHGVSRARIVAVSGSSLLVRSEDPKTVGTRYVVDGRSGAADRAADGAWFPRLGGGWWIADAGHLMSGDETPLGPPRLRHAGSGDGRLRGGADERRRTHALGSAVELDRALGRPPHTRYIGGDANRIALADPRCPAPASPRCSIEIVDVGTGRTRSVPVPFPDQFVRSAVFSADGRRMAIWGTKGVSLVDPATGSAVVTLKAAQLATTPLTFTPDATELLVLEDPAPYRQVVVLRADNGRFVRSWVSEQQLEQIVALSTSDSGRRSRVGPCRTSSDEVTARVRARRRSSGSRQSERCSLPDDVFGNEPGFTSTTSSGGMPTASYTALFTASRMRSSSSPLLSATTTSDSRPRLPSVPNAITLPARTPVTSATARSTSCGYTLRPPRMMTSLIRPQTTSSPSTR